MVLDSLLHLTFYGNPVASLPGYRHYLVNSMPQLIVVDTQIVTDDERTEMFAGRFTLDDPKTYVSLPAYPAQNSDAS